MSHRLHGTVESDGLGVSGVVLEVIQAAGAARSFLGQRVRAGFRGEYSFSLPEPAPLSVRLLDRAGKVLVERLELQGNQQGRVAPIRLARRVGLTPPTPAKLAPGVESITESWLVAAKQAGAVQETQELLASLPPLAISPGLLEHARGVLQGKTQHIRAFKAAWREMQSWSAQHGLELPSIVSEPAKLTEASFWAENRARLPPVQRSPQSRLFERGAPATIALAAVRLAREPEAIQQALVLLDHQLASLDHLEDLEQHHRALQSGDAGAGAQFKAAVERSRRDLQPLAGIISPAASALKSEVTDRLQVHTGGGALGAADFPFSNGQMWGASGPLLGGPLELGFDGVDPGPRGDPSAGVGGVGHIGGGIGEPIGTNRGRGAGGRRTPPSESPEPSPRRIWPFHPDAPIPKLGVFPDRLEMWDCMAALLPDWQQFIADTVHYEIEAATPPRACPGQTITLTGRNLRFRGQAGKVLFVSHDGSAIEAVHSSWSDDKIELTVPPGAACNDLELDIPNSVVYHASCAAIDLHLGPLTPFHYDGGATTVRTFELDPEEERCFSSGKRVRFRYGTCNADRVRLSLRTPEGVELSSVAGDRSGRLEVVVPELSENSWLTAVLVAQGPCGEDERRLALPVHARPSDESDGRFVERELVNWHQNIRRTLPTATPTTRASLLQAIAAAEEESMRLGIAGSNWSYSNCVLSPAEGSEPASPGTVASALPHGVISTRMLRCEHLRSTSRDSGTTVRQRLVQTYDLTEFMQDAFKDEVRSVMNARMLRHLKASENARGRLVHALANIQLSELNCLLDEKGLAMATLGGSNGQTLSGTPGTATHGTNPDLPPIQDFVRAIHLIGPGGVEWWLEPASLPVTDPSAFEQLKRSNAFYMCVRAVYDDALFNACLVSLGAAGLIYSVVLEAVPAYHLKSRTEAMDWAGAKAAIEEEALSDAPPFFFEVAAGTSGSVRLTRRQWTDAPVSTAPASTFKLDTLAAGLLAGVAGLGLLTAIGNYVAQRVALALTGPAVVFGLDRDMKIVEGLGQGIEAAVEALASGGIPKEQEPTKVVELLNFIWQLGIFNIPGRVLVEEFQDQFTAMLRPEGTTVDKSYIVLTEQKGCEPAEHDLFYRLIESYEYVMPADACVEFVEDVTRLVHAVRHDENNALILAINVRFTLGTRAKLGMQQYPKTGYVELWTIRGIAGNPSFHARLEELARSKGVIPHWGHLHRQHDGGRRLDFATVYGPNLRRWSDALDRIARASGGTPNTFRHSFVLERGLLQELPRRGED